MIERPSPRIHYFGSFFGTAVGVPQPCELLAPALQRRGAEVRTSSSRRARAARSVDYAVAAVRARGRGGVAVIDTFSGAAFQWADMVERIARSRCITIAVLHGGGLPADAGRRPAIGRYLDRVAAVVSPSSFLAGRLEAFRGGIRVIPNPLELAGYHPRPGPAVPDPRAPRILWLRAFHEIYDPETAVVVLSLLREVCPGARLSMVGPDKDGSLDAVRGRARELGLEDAVATPGPVPKEQVPSVMRDHDLFLSTATVDNAPVSVTEAMACRMPVVATAMGGVPDLLDHGRAGALVAPGDAAAMAAALTAFCENPDHAERTAIAARDRARAHDVDRVAEQWLELVAEVTAGHESGRMNR